MRTKTGQVVTAKDKTIVIRVETYRTHSKYKKRYRVSSKFHAHDEEEKYKVGDKVTIYECRPLSKMKRWTVVEPSAARLTEKKESPKKEETSSQSGLDEKPDSKPSTT
tara:strand:- start:431 stop:754 length:324 start_codon:yes stop_codon:yes gene_type:complete